MNFIGGPLDGEPIEWHIPPDTGATRIQFAIDGRGRRAHMGDPIASVATYVCRTVHWVYEEAEESPQP